MMQKLSNSKFCLALVLMAALVSVVVSNQNGIEQGKTEAKSEKVKPVVYEVKVLSVQLDEVKTESEVEPPKLFYIPEIPLSRELQQYTYDLCLEKNVDYEIVLAVMWRESRFDIDATGYNNNGTQDSGIMQINDINKEWIADELGVNDLYDPYQNVLVGTTMLSDFINTYGEHDGLMAYGVGETGMSRLKVRGISTLDNIQLALNKRDEIELMEKVE